VQLREFCRELLADYFRGSRVVELRNASGIFAIESDIHGR
jgi:hypothetical protein